MGKKLLVADDSVTIQKVIKLALSSEGYDILAVSDGKEAVRAIQEERPDAVLIDVALPGLDAYQVKRAINADPKVATTGFILLASAFERVDEKLVDEVGFHARLIKPFDPSHLRKAVGELMGKAASGGIPAAPPPPPSIELGRPERPDEDAPLPDEEDADLPPVTDMHPTVTDIPAAPPVTETEFKFDTPTMIVTPPPAPPAAPPTAAPSEEIDEINATRTLENDIKDLTESTIKLSGLDEYEWSLDDSRKMKSPDAAAPTPKAPAAPKAPAPTPPPADRTLEIQRPGKETSALKNVISIPSKPIDDGGTNFPFKPAASSPKQTPSSPTHEEPRAPEPAFQPPPKPSAPTPTPPPGSGIVSGRDFLGSSFDPTQLEPSPAAPTYAPPPSAAASSPITRAEVEALIRKDVAEVVERLAREIVPQVAEAIIRKEIEKILAET